MEIKDEELIVEYYQGDQAAFTALFQRYKRPVLNFALRLIDNRADAEDVVEEVFMSLLQQKYTIRAGAKFSTWMFRVAHNACMTHFRKKKHVASLWFKKNDENDYASWDVADTADLPHEEIAKQESAMQVKKAIAKLPLEQKEALVLREYNGLAYDQISVILECSLEKVKILIFRARERLRVELQPPTLGGDK